MRNLAARVILKGEDIDRFFSATIPDWTTGRRQVKAGNAKQAVEEYKSWIYACASKNATSVSSVPLRLYTAKRSKASKINYPSKKVSPKRLKYMESSKSLQPYLSSAQETEEITEHPFLDLMRNVNSFFNQFDTMELTTLFLEQTGDAYWLVVPNRLGVPTEIWVLPSQNMTIVPSKKEFISHYEYRGEGQAEPVIFKKEEIIHFRYPSLSSLYYGWSPFYAATNAVNINNFMSTYDIATFQNMARPDVTFETKDDIDKDTAMRMLAAWKEQYQGAKNVGKGAFLPPGYKVSRFSLTPAELNHLEGKRWTRGEIATIYGVPEALVATEKVNRANMESSIYVYMKWAILPRLVRQEQKLNERLIPMFDEKLFVAFDDPIPENKELRLKEIESHLKNLYSNVNQERAIDGEETVPWGDKIYAPINIVPLGSTEKNIEAISGKVAEKVKKGLLEEIDVE